ncbi:MAG: HAMP domain-containing sensor histidine kinase [Hyphomicrobiaceae bacterium]
MAPARLLRSRVFRRTLGVVLLLACVAAMVTGLVGWHANTIYTRAAERSIETDAAELRSELVARGFEALVKAIAERSRSGGSGVYYVADAAGTYRAGNITRLPDWRGPFGRGLFSYATPAGPRMAAGLLIQIDGEPRLVVGRDIEDQRELLLAIYRTIGFGTALLLLLGVGGSVLIARHIQARIESMSGASADIMSGNLSGRIPVDGSGDELDRLAVQLNDMLDRIEQLMAGLREVSDNIAHDLKTPLNRLRNRAEAALADSGGAEAWRFGLERVIDEADELIKTFNALLLIARLEAGSSSEGIEIFDVAPLAADVAELYQPVAEDAGFSLDCSIVRDVPVRGNRQLLSQALANLIDNSLKYAAHALPPRSIEIAVKRVPPFVELVVADRGPGIAPSDRDRALRRFVRLEESRSLPGTGLGLSLVAAVARLHRGHVRLEDNAPGLKVVVQLPLARVAQPMPELPPERRLEAEAAKG